MAVDLDVDVVLDAEVMDTPVPLMPCLENAISVRKPNHHVRVALVQHMADMLREHADPRDLSPDQRRLIEDTIYEFIKRQGWSNFNPSLSRKGIRTNLNYRNTPTCAWFANRGMCPGKCWRHDGTTP